MSGFENFPCNGLDQFLINATNEKLQMYFMDYIFPREQRDYELEGIAWKDILYHSNEDVLNLLFQVSYRSASKKYNMLIFEIKPVKNNG